MDNQYNNLFFSSLFFFITSLLIGGTQVAHGSAHPYPHQNHQHQTNSSIRISKLFVFGDSYVDTGNTVKYSRAWHIPYGITFPGKPSGRFSDGRVLTDYLASFLRIKSPIPYRWRKFAGKSLQYGVNFAQGGTGVFDTLYPGPNLATQIHFLEQQLKDGVYTKFDLENSMALVSVAGNDYDTYLSNNGSIQGLPTFITSVVNQLALDSKRIQQLGVKKVAVTSLQPLGCLPQRTANSWSQTCNETLNSLVEFHNNLFRETLAKLNNITNESPFVILDLYTAFFSAIKSAGYRPGMMKFESPLVPCCLGISNEYSCGYVDVNNAKKYTVCRDPKSSFFWDTVHPSQEGWSAVFSVLRASVQT